jgi:hypothetical protein
VLWASIYSRVICDGDADNDVNFPVAIQAPSIQGSMMTRNGHCQLAPSGIQRNERTFSTAVDVVVDSGSTITQVILNVRT